MTKLTQDTEQTGYSLGGLNRQFVESIENDIIDFVLPSNTKDKNTN
ncbi:hypothetical protein HYX00_01100 [Candidatus Woesearchaeota archaeon]|nr:hypothetical protein [Candidatus Woesearchaeota archaeon]